MYFDYTKEDTRDREKHLLDEVQSNSGVYFLKHSELNIIKFGSSYNVSERIKKHKRTFGESVIFLDNVIETTSYIVIESIVRQYSNTTFTDSSGYTHTEIIQFNDTEELKNIYRSIYKDIFNGLVPDSSKLDIQKEITKQKEIEIKQKEIETKQKEIVLQMNNETHKHNIEKMELDYKMKLDIEQRLEQREMDKLEMKAKLTLERIDFEHKLKSKPIKYQDQSQDQSQDQDNDIYVWCDINIFQDNSENVLRIESLFDIFDNKHLYKYKDFKKCVEMYFKRKYNNICAQHKINNGSRPRGYRGFTLK
ncbi:hypothetical protein SAGO17_0020 [Mimivirus AB-566-O17]|uniref:GIY-YIG domain-containing protein n=1 Tax=Mimivirus AB-566-O17 TaxID=1988039 RepID=A0A1X9VNP8_9VIRU|nr:hypothetical protein SAGO17_0020 [Mimivirus AB-566-O17]